MPFGICFMREEWVLTAVGIILSAAGASFQETFTFHTNKPW